MRQNKGACLQSGEKIVAAKSKGDRFPLLIYLRWARMLRLPSLLIAITAGVGWWFEPDHPLLAGRGWVLFAIGGIGAVIFLYSLWVRRTAYVQCFPRYVKIRTPFLSVVVSYKRVLKVRPIEFHSQLPVADMKATRRRLLQPFLTNTVILLELKGFPLTERWLRLWIPQFMLAREVTGFVLVVEDWMALSRQISTFTDRWVSERRTRPRSTVERMY